MSSQVRNLKSAEWGGGPVMPAGDALLAGYYANELLMRLLARDDPHPRLFDGYALLVQVLADAQGNAGPPQVSLSPSGGGLGTAWPWGRSGRESVQRTAALRAFELLLLREAGLLPALDAATLTLAPLAADTPYRLSPEGGLLACDGTGAQMPAVPGAAWQALEQALTDAVPFAALLAAIQPWAPRERAQLRQLLRTWLDTHGGHAFKTRQLLHDLRTL
jgi:DNA repair protein RecO (recombination protein O)